MLHKILIITAWSQESEIVTFYVTLFGAALMKKGGKQAMEGLPGRLMICNNVTLQKCYNVTVKFIGRGHL